MVSEKSKVVNNQEVNFFKSPFLYKQQIYYIPVYPRGFLQQIISIDEQRRTVTLKIVLYITLCIKVKDEKLRKYLADHLILQFGYNQIIFIPEDITLENSPFLITKIPMKDDKDYSTFRIKGKIQCNAEFDSMLFPYRLIEVSNHLCINSQQFRQKDQKGRQVQYTIKYNFLTLTGDSQKFQFAPQFNNISFGSFKVDNESFEVANDTDPQPLKKKRKLDNQYILGKIAELAEKKNDLTRSKRQQNGMEVQPKQLNMQEQYLMKKTDQLLDFQPYKHIVFRFSMGSLHLAFILQQQVPIFMLSIVTLFLFHAEPNIGNKYNCIILLLVSYISIISSFRLNNIAQQLLTFFEYKLMILSSVPILLIITTQIDYYNMDLFNNRGNQISNPFAYVSLAIVVICFVLTLIFLVFVWLRYFFSSSKDQNIKQSLMDWGNMKELDWVNHELELKIVHILHSNRDRNWLDFFDEELMNNLHMKSEHEPSDETTHNRIKAVSVKNNFNTVQDE